MTAIMLGNLSPEEFARRVDAEFTDEEIAQLRSTWSQKAELTGPEDFHFFDIPLAITFGSMDNKAMEILKAANDRKTFSRPVSGILDNGWDRSGK